MDIAPTDTRQIEGEELTAWSVLSGGTQICLDLSATDGEAHRIVLPFDLVSGLMMTLPRILQSALAQRFSDSSFRVVQWLGTWQLEQQSADHGLILTLATTDGFEVAFALNHADAGALGAALLGARQDNHSPLVRRPN